MAIESRRLDKLEEAITLNPDRTLQLLKYAFEVCTEVIISREFRREILAKLADIYSRGDNIDYVSICECKFLLNEPKAIAAADGQPTSTMSR